MFSSWICQYRSILRSRWGCSGVLCTCTFWVKVKSIWIRITNRQQLESALETQNTPIWWIWGNGWLARENTCILFRVAPFFPHRTSPRKRYEKGIKFLLESDSFNAVSFSLHHGSFMGQRGASDFRLYAGGIVGRRTHGSSQCRLGASGEGEEDRIGRSLSTNAPWVVAWWNMFVRWRMVLNIDWNQKLEGDARIWKFLVIRKVMQLNVESALLWHCGAVNKFTLAVCS